MGGARGCICAGSCLGAGARSTPTPPTPTPAPGFRGPAGGWESSRREREQGRWAGYLGCARLTNLTAWSFYANLKVCYRAVGGQLRQDGLS